MAASDRILEAYINDFVKEYNLEDLRKSEAFERFVNHTVLSRLIIDEFEVENISIGGGQDGGLDGVAIIVNDHLVTTEEEIDYFINRFGRLEVQFVFLQSKLSDKFDSGDIGTFLFGVRNFFEDESKIKISGKIENLMALQRHIYSRSVDMDSPPSCSIFYVTAGKWVNDETLVGRITVETNHLEEMGIFSDIEFFPIDLETIRKIYRELKHKVEREFQFKDHTILPPIENVRESYIGIIPCKEYLRIICDSDGYLQKNLFYDNIRDFQGYNAVNREIRDTIHNSEKSDRFALLNNGVTIVAKSLNKVGTAFKTKDFQIVNGCQTSHILYRHKENLIDNMYLPLKLIVTSDSEVTSQITKGTNRQTEVKIEAFEALSPFHKKLEEFYSTFHKEKGEKLYYERRSKQYESYPISKNQIVSLTMQIKCFLSMFLNEPHSTHRYYGELLKANRNKIFVEDHSLYPYYVSAYALYLLEKFLNTNKIDRFFRLFKLHMLLILKLNIVGKKAPTLNSKKMDKYCLDLQDILWDEDKVLEGFIRAKEVIQAGLKDYTYGPWQAARRRDFTEKIISLVTDEKEIADPKREQGFIEWFDDIRGYGIIANENGDEIFVHYSSIKRDGYRTLVKGQKVEYSKIKNGKRIEALDVRELD